MSSLSDDHNKVVLYAFATISGITKMPVNDETGDECFGFENKKKLPDDMDMDDVAGNFVIESCDKLTTLLPFMNVGGNMSITMCPSITSLSGTNVKIGGDFTITSCINLRYLPSGIISGDLIVINCPLIIHIPDNLQVEGNIINE